MNKTINFLIVGFFTLALFVIGTIGLNHQANAAAIPTPISNPAVSDSATNVTYWQDVGLVADGGSNSKQLLAYEFQDIHYEINQTDVAIAGGTLVNTVTVRLEFSNDPDCVVGTGSSANWASGINLVATNAADADEMLQVNNIGRCTRLYADVANTNPVTLSVWAVAK